MLIHGNGCFPTTRRYPPGCASLIAFDGSAFEVTLCAAFSLDVSVKLALEKDPILLRFLLLVKLRTDLARGLR